MIALVNTKESLKKYSRAPALFLNILINNLFLLIDKSTLSLRWWYYALYLDKYSNTGH